MLLVMVATTGNRACGHFWISTRSTRALGSSSASTLRENFHLEKIGTNAIKTLRGRSSLTLVEGLLQLIGESEDIGKTNDRMTRKFHFMR